MSEDELTQEEERELLEYLAPKKEEKVGMFHFFNKILGLPTTSKVSNLDDEELRVVRIMQTTSAYAEEMGLDKVAYYIGKEAEIILSTADSKKGFLIKAAITQKRELESKTKSGGSKGWLKKKEKD